MVVQIILYCPVSDEAIEKEDRTIGRKGDFPPRGEIDGHHCLNCQCRGQRNRDEVAKRRSFENDGCDSQAYQEPECDAHMRIMRRLCDVEDQQKRVIFPFRQAIAFNGREIDSTPNFVMTPTFGTRGASARSTTNTVRIDCPTTIGHRVCCQCKMPTKML